MALIEPDAVKTVAVLGMGSVGSGWTALLLARGIAVRAFDPGAGAQATSEQLIAGAWPSLIELGHTKAATPPLDQLRFCATYDDALEGADVVFENVPEKLDLKHDVLRMADAATGPETPILSSAGGISPTQMQEVCTHPERLAVVHPFNPSHLIPLVEIVPGEETSPETTAWATEFSLLLGKKPITLSREMPGHMVNRLQFALVREAISCLMDGVATAEDIDTAVRFGLAPRWLLQGGLQTVAMAGGPGGMYGILDHAGPAMETWWTPRSQVKMTHGVKQKMVKAAQELSDGAGFEDWVAWRDSHLVSLFSLQAQADAERPGKRAGRDQ
ncbi:MAG: 3-hydroxyacyl-CoA dehydrogenase NAD-binding domain-containing protein [Pseudomonadota bacterium]